MYYQVQVTIETPTPKGGVRCREKGKREICGCHIRLGSFQNQ